MGRRRLRRLPAGVAKVEAELGPVEILVNNAGITRDATMKRMSRDMWDAVIDTNLGSCFNMCKAVWDGMNARLVRPHRQHRLDQRPGRPVRPGELRRGEVRHPRLHQGAGAGRRARRHHRQRDRAGLYRHRHGRAPCRADVLEKIVARIPVGRLGKADEIARGVAFLVADDAGFITGSTLSINGGQHMY
jgi:acetoacetyl-CoA reductase